MNVDAFKLDHDERVVIGVALAVAVVGLVLMIGPFRLQVTVPTPRPLR